MADVETFVRAAAPLTIAVNVNSAFFPAYQSERGEHFNRGMIELLEQAKIDGFNIIGYSSKPEVIRSNLADALMIAKADSNLFSSFEHQSTLDGKTVFMIIGDNAQQINSLGVKIDNRDNVVTQFQSPEDLDSIRQKLRAPVTPSVPNPAPAPANGQTSGAAAAPKSP